MRRAFPETPLARHAFARQYANAMTLDEIEIAANELPSAKKAELLLFLAESLRRDQAPLPTPREFTERQLTEWMDEDEAAMRRFEAGS
jgi:hypothetical protein